jgi:serine/threonine-protein kinase PpkA
LTLEQNSMTAEKMTHWRCQNYGACAKADAKDHILLVEGRIFVCPECGSDIGLQTKSTSSIRGVLKPMLLGVAALLTLLILAKMLTPPPKPKPDPKQVATKDTRKKPEEPPPTGPLTDGRTGLASQILTRPKSALYANASKDQKLPQKPQNFERFFVFEKKEGWLRVGKDSKSSLGWITDEDAVDWPHSMVVEYTPPDNRKPVLFFREQSGLQKLLDSENLASDAGNSYKDIEEKGSTGSIFQSDYPVLSIEPAYKIKDLRIMPVLESQETEIAGRPARLLKVTAAGLDRGATTLQDKGYVQQAAPTRSGVAALQGVDIDLVFVMDMTGSMQPWVNGALAAIRDLAQKIDGNPAVAGRMKLGFWGYQDDPGLTNIQYRTRNFTPSLLSPRGFSDYLASIKVNTLTNDSWPEDVFAGVTDAIKLTKWRAATRILVLIGDAPGHTSIKEGAVSNLDAPQVRQLATDANIKIVSIVIKDPGTSPARAKFNARAAEQFTVLASNGNRAPALLRVSSGDTTPFKNILDVLTEELALQPSLNNPPANEPMDDPTRDIARGLLAAAKVEVVSETVNKQGQIVAPRDITAWVVDRDLLNPAVPSLEPKLLISKNELSSLQSVASSILAEAKKNVIIGGDFYTQVMGAVAETASGGRSKTLADRLPKFIKGLPYKSDLMEKSADWWGTQTAEQQGEFIKSLEAKLAYYRAINEDPSMWKPLNKDAEAGDYVTAISLSQLL